MTQIIQLTEEEKIVLWDFPWQASVPGVRLKADCQHLPWHRP
jgi:hypothetical protein